MVSKPEYQIHDLPKQDADATNDLTWVGRQKRYSYFLVNLDAFALPVEVDKGGGLRLSPRKSFELWQETVRAKSLEWKPCEIAAVLDLRGAIVSIVLRQADELAKINIELERSNTELDAFAYIGSHDLKEPLRGIHNYSNFLIEDYAHILNEEGVSKLQTLVRLTQRMEDLINSLLHFSRLGRMELAIFPTNLNAIVQQVLDLLSA